MRQELVSGLQRVAGTVAATLFVAYGVYGIAFIMVRFLHDRGVPQTSWTVSTVRWFYTWQDVGGIVLHTLPLLLFALFFFRRLEKDASHP